MRQVNDLSKLPSIAPSRSLPVLRGLQAGREYYLGMCSLDWVAKNLPFPPENLPPEKVLQRQINKARIPKIADYLVKFFDDYILPPLIVSIDADVDFFPLSTNDDHYQMGQLSFLESADFIINDGQHRCAAIKHALAKRPELKLESIGIVFFVDRGVKRSRQMFSDLNGHPVRTNQNINTTFDSRSYLPGVTKHVIDSSDLLRTRVEHFGSSCAIGSPKIFTISAVAKAHSLLLKGFMSKERDVDAEVCSSFWAVLRKNLPDLEKLANERVTSRQVKEAYFYPYSIALQALASTANFLIRENKDSWERKFADISKLDWRRSNPDWEGRAMSAGRLTTSGNHPILTRNLIKQHLRLTLTEEEIQIENEFKRRDSSN